MDLQPILDVAIEAAYEAGRITLSYFQTGMLETETKEDLSPVTVADRKAEEAITSIVRRHFPSHAILGEEFGEIPGSDPIRWIIDPIDGTKSFISGVPLYGVMIGVEVEGEASVGVVHMPALGELYHGARGEGSYWNGRRARVSATDRLEDAVVVCYDVRQFFRESRMAAAYGELLHRTKFHRTWGDCYGYMLVATGRVDIAIDSKMSIWDNAALKPIIEEAGGTFTDWSGVPTIDSSNALATNGLLHAEVLSILNSGHDTNGG
jgi:histidinol phosphatase-like enzyme (inositol monophosphatase family)